MADLIPILEFARQQNVTGITARRWANAGLFGLPLPTRWRGARQFVAMADFEQWQRDVDATRERQKARRQQPINFKAEAKQINAAKKRLATIHGFKFEEATS